MKVHDVFISYRRTGGSELAHLLRVELEKRGYRVFMDVEGLDQGHFDEALLRHIESSRSFIVVLNHGALERCDDEQDWLRREIAHALSHKRRIVPVTMVGFKFPEPSTLPKDIAGLPRHQAIEYNHKFLSSTVDRVCNFVGRPRAYDSFTHLLRKTWKRATAVALALVVFALAMAYWLLGQSSLAPADKSMLTALATDMGVQLGRVNVELSEIAKTSDKAQTFFAQTPDETTTVNELAEWCAHRLNELKRLQVEPQWKGGREDVLDRLGVPSADVHSLYAVGWPLFWGEVEGFYRQTKVYAELPPAGRLLQQGRIVRLQAENLKYHAETLYFGVLHLLAHFPEETLDTFMEFRAELTKLPDTGMLPAEEAETRLERLLGLMDENVHELAQLTGGESISASMLEEQLSQLQAKADGIEQMKDQLAATESLLAARRAELAEKFRLQPGDDPWLMWGKLLRLCTADMRELAIERLDTFVEYAPDTMPPAAIEAARAFWSLPEPPDAGVLVFGFEHDAAHSVLRPGDIVLKTGSTPLRFGEEFAAAPKLPAGTPRAYTLMRLRDGAFTVMEATGEVDDPRVGVADLREEPF